MQKQLINYIGLVFFLALSFNSLAQTITIAGVDPGPYGNGSDVSVPIAVSGSFKKDNKFELYLSDATGSFVSQKLIGSFDSHFATFVNGVIPSGTLAGAAYKLKIRSTNPEVEVTCSSAITISSAEGPAIKIVTSESNRTLLADKIFGYCSQIQDDNALAIKNQSSAGAIVSGDLINDYDNTKTPVNFDFSSGDLQELNLDIGYYTARLKAVNNGIVSVKSYVVLNSTYNLSLQSSGSQSICIRQIPDGNSEKIRYSVNTNTDNKGSIITNYPGLLYRFDWGDGKADSLSQYDLVSASGNVEHQYLKSSCGQPPIVLASTIYNSYQANIFIVSNFCTGASVPITTYPKVFLMPEADFQVPATGGCVNRNIVFANTTTPGESENASGTDCSDETFYKWYIKKSTETVWKLSSDDQNMVHLFSTPGVYNIRLVASNNGCLPTEKIQDICIEEPPKTDFEFIQSADCAPVTIKPINKTSLLDQCHLSWLWEVVDSLSGSIVTNGIQFLSPDSSLAPEINVTEPGSYLLRLTAINTCDRISVEKPFTVAGPLKVSLPDEQKYCMPLPLIIDFSSDVNHQVVYNGFGKDKRFKWTVSGGTYSFIKGTEDSGYPAIQFNDAAEYKVSVTYVNECNTPVGDTQVITFYGPITKDAGPDAFICDNVAGGANSSYVLHGNQPGVAETGLWTFESGPASLVFDDPTKPGATVSSLIPGTYKLRWTISNPASCRQFDDMLLTVYPKPQAGAISGLARVCIDGSGTLEINGSVGKIIQWESSTDNNIWTSIADTASSYTYTNLQQRTYFRVKVGSLGNEHSCSTEVYSSPFMVDVDPESAGGITTGAQTFCAGLPNTGQITLSGNTGSIIRWERSTDGGSAWIRISSSQDQNPYTFTNISATTQFRAVVQSGECSLSYSAVTTIEILSRPTMANAGEDDKVCLTGSVYLLNGNNPSVGTGEWTQKAGPLAIIDNPSLYNSGLSGLQKGQRYQFAWTISNGVCDPSISVVTLDILTDITNSIKTDRPLSCRGDAVNLVTDILKGGDINSLVPPNYTFLWEWSPNGSDSWAPVPGGNTQNITVHPTFTTYYRRTVSSFESCRVISDPVMITINAGTPSSIAGADVALCNVTAYQLHANDAGLGFTGTWRDKAGGSSLIFVPDVHAFNAEVRGLEPGKVYELEWSIAGISPCPDEISAVKIIVRKVVTSANAGNPQQICLNQSGSNNHIMLEGNQPDISNGEKGMWTQLAGLPATLVNPQQYNTDLTDLRPGTYAFEWEISSDATGAEPGCNVSKSVLTINVIPFPVAGNISGGNISVCNGDDPGELVLNGYTAGALLQWQSSADNNIYTDIPSATSEKYAPGNLTKTTWYQVLVMQPGGCSGTVKSVPVKIQADEPSVGGTANSSVTRVCTGVNTGSITLTGQKGNIIRWEISVDNEASWTPIASSANPYVFNNLTADTRYRAVVANGICPATNSSSVLMEVLPNVTSAIAGTDQYLCNATEFNLDGNTPQKGTGLWTRLSGPPATITDPADPKAKVTGLAPGSYIFVWSISNNICDPSTDTITVYNYPALTNQITGNATICSGQTVHITGQEPTGGNSVYTYQWETSSSGNDPWIIASGMTSEDFTQILTSSVYIRRIVNSGPCSLESNAVYIVVQPPIDNNIITGDQELCLGQSSAGITGSIPTGADGTYFYRWQKSNDNINWLDVTGETAKDLQPFLLSETTFFHRIVSSAFCNGDQQNISSAVKIVVHPLSKAEFSASSQKDCAPFNLKQVITPVPYNDRNSSYEWFADGVSIGMGSDFPGYTIVSDGDQVSVKLVTTSKFGCGSDTREMTFSTVKHVSASFTKDQVKGCGPLAVQFTNTSMPLSGINYSWNFGNGRISDQEQPGIMVFQPHPLHRDTTYVITLTASTECQSTVFRDSVLVRAKPLAVFSPDKTRGCSPLEVTVANQSAGLPNTYTFDFGDGTTLIKADNSEVKHTYYTTKTDTLTIKLTAENECGTDTSSYKIVVYPNTVTAELVVDGNKKFGCLPFAVKFDNNSVGANNFSWDFKDGSTAITESAPESIVHTFTTPGTYQVSLLATNGCSVDTTSETIIVYPKPNSEFSLVKPVYCVKNPVEFINDGSPSCSYIWDFDDGSSGNAFNPEHIYQNPGRYTVKLTANQSYPDGSICSNTTSHEVVIDPLPVALFTSNSTTQNCTPFKLTVSSTPENAANVEWHFDDPLSSDNVAAGYTAEHIYTRPGLYRVKAIAYNSEGCMDSVIKLVKVLERPESAFLASDTLICGPGATIKFVNQTMYGGADAVTYRWLINNSFISAQKDLTYTFNTPVGVILPYKYVVKLISLSTVGCPDTSVRTIQFNPLPKAAFTSGINIGCPPFKADLRNNSLYADQFFWYLDGKLVSTNREPSNIVLNEPDKTYSLKLVAGNIYGCRLDSIEKTFSTYPKPKASFMPADSVSCDGILDLKINNTSDGATRYVWDFGDNSPLVTNAVPQHVYGQPGVYYLRLIAYNSFCSDTATKIIRIAGVPQAAFAADVTKGCTQMSVIFQNLSVNASTYLWDFGDGSFSTSKNPVHSFNYIKSPFSVKLIAFGEYGCSDTTVLTNYIQITAPPNADFVALSDTVIKIPDYTFTFKNTSTGNPVKYSWSFGDGKYSAEESPVHTYINTGSYTVQLVATNIEGCIAITEKKVRIDGVPGYLYVPSGFEPGSQKAEIKTFIPKGSGIAKYSLKIFNKWGKLVWQTDKLDENGSPAEGWDGTTGGHPEPQGVYIWDISATFIDGEEWKGMKYETGTRKTVGPIHLIR